ncbi:hypothetical protein L0F63_001854 [Massospora cicadina]|nr:hypothetical protein L0F63_001854 [Massospora cicadina]
MSIYPQDTCLRPITLRFNLHPPLKTPNLHPDPTKDRSVIGQRRTLGSASEGALELGAAVDPAHPSWVLRRMRATVQVEQPRARRFELTAPDTSRGVTTRGPKSLAAKVIVNRQNL